MERVTSDDDRAITLTPAEFDGFYGANWHRVVGALRVAFGSTSLAEDAAQDAFVKAYVRWRRVRRMEQPGRWVTTVAFRRAMRLARRRPETQLSDAHDLGRAAEHEVEQHDAFADALAPLTERQRIAAVLRYECDLPTKEIARIMGCADPTVRALLSQAADRLRVAPHGGEVG